jgi:hypothetical protein
MIYKLSLLEVHRINSKKLEPLLQLAYGTNLEDFT